MTSEEPALIPQSPFDFAHGPEPVEGREKGLSITFRHVFHQPARTSALPRAPFQWHDAAFLFSGGRHVSVAADGSVGLLDVSRVRNVGSGSRAREEAGGGAAFTRRIASRRSGNQASRQARRKDTSSARRAGGHAPPDHGRREDAESHRPRRDAAQ